MVGIVSLRMQISLIYKHSSITHKLMVRATNNFERQIRIPVLAKDKPKPAFTPPQSSNSPSTLNGLGFDFHRVQEGNRRNMTGEQVIGWYEKVLESVKARYRKLQRFSRYATFDIELFSVFIMVLQCTCSEIRKRCRIFT